ncbi:hypothetical protein TNCT6_64710 [Streptomyces sp. 6-11-2]|nr:hypothetical protein TNCT6_64710 [Streptomyces sp. 6-11-2]
MDGTGRVADVGTVADGPMREEARCAWGPAQRPEHRLSGAAHGPEPQPSGKLGPGAHSGHRR